MTDEPVQVTSDAQDAARISLQSLPPVLRSLIERPRISEQPKPDVFAVTLVTWLAEQWRLLIFFAVVVVSTVIFRYITLTGQPDRVSTWPEALYWSISLFVLQTNGFPHTGPPTLIKVGWLMYFLAPLVSLSAFIEVIHRIGVAATSPDRLVRKMRNHFIVCGYGKHGRMVLDNLLDRYPDEQVVIIDNDPTLGHAVYCGERRFPVLQADLHFDSAGALRRAQLERARELIVATGEDMLNVAVCVTAGGCKTAAGFRTLALVGDMELVRGFEAIVAAESGRVRLLNTYELAAQSLLDVISPAESPFDPATRNLVILGFGRFGTALVRGALNRWPDVERKPWIVVVDLKASERLRTIARFYKFSPSMVSAIDGDIEDPEVMDAAVGNHGLDHPLVILCTDKEASNLRTALQLRTSMVDAQPIVLTRMFERPPHHLEQLLTKYHIQCFELRDLIADKLEC